MVNKPKKEKESIKVTYIYQKPKNEAEAIEQQRSVNSAYDMLFDLVLEERKKKKIVKESNIDIV
jgi:hypothetical protein